MSRYVQNLYKLYTITYNKWHNITLSLLQTTLVTLVLVIGTRLDFFSVLYSAWLVPMFWMSRKQLQFKIWMPFITFLTILLPLQYLSSVGIPPFLCVGKNNYNWYPSAEKWELYHWKSLDYPWTPLDPELKGWLFLPDFVAPPDISRLVRKSAPYKS